MSVNALENLARIIVENQTQQIFQPFAVRHMPAENRGAALAPRQLRRRRLARKPVMLAQNIQHVPGCKGILRVLVRNGSFSSGHKAEFRKSQTDYKPVAINASRASLSRARLWLLRARSRRLLHLSSPSGGSFPAKRPEHGPKRHAFSRNAGRAWAFPL